MLLQILQIITLFLSIIAGISVAFLIVYQFTTKQIVKKLLEDGPNTSKIKKLKKSKRANNPIQIAPIEYLRKLIIRSNLHHRYFTPYTLLAISSILFITSLIMLSKMLQIAEAFFIALFVAFIPEIILYLYGESKSKAMNGSYIGFLNILENFLSTRDDINYAIEQASNYQKQLPLISDYCREYMFDISHGFTPMDSLRKFSNKIDNVQMKNLLYTLISCNINSGKYLNVVKQSKANYLELYDKLIERQIRARKGRMTILVMLVLYALIFVALNFINGNMYYILTQTSFGIAVTIFSIFSFIITFFVAINVGHFNFD